MAGNEIDVWIPRKTEGGDDIPHYEHRDYFTMKIYHGGNIFGNKYVGGKISYYDYVDKDRMSLTEVDNMVKGLNPDYGGSRIDYWFRIGSEDDALTKLNLDLDVMTMVCCVPDERLVILYLDHIYEGDEEDNEEDEVYMYPADFDFMFSQSGSIGVVIEELPDEPRQKPTCVIEEIFDEPKKPTNETRKPKRSTGHKVKTCHRHLPPKDKNAANKKRKMNSGDASSSQPKLGKRPPLSKNELRKKHLQVAEYQRKKMAELKASRKQGAKATAATTAKAAAISTSTSTRPPTSTKASKGQAPIAS